MTDPHERFGRWWSGKVREFPGYILRVIDGDTCWALLDKGLRCYSAHPLRIADLDTPETYRPKDDAELERGRDATATARQLLGFDQGPHSQRMSRHVTVRTLRADPQVYGRWLADITLADGRDYATVMRELGHTK